MVNYHSCDISQLQRTITPRVRL